MDPLSVASGCVGIMGAIVKTSSTIRQFVRDVREARGQLSTTAQQLAELEMTISLIEDDHNTETDTVCMPETVTKQTAAVIQSCLQVLGELDTVMDQYNPRSHRAPLKWAFKGKDEVAALNRQLEAHSRTLQMSLEVSTLVTTKSIKTDTVTLGVVTGQIKEDTGHIRDDTGTILQEIDELRGLVARQLLPEHLHTRIDIIDNYLESLTEYVETTIDSADFVGEHSLNNEARHHELPVQRSTVVFRPKTDNGYQQTKSTDLAARYDLPASVSDRIPRFLDDRSTWGQQKPKRFVNPHSPVSLLLVGPSQSGKSAFINRLIRLATNDVRMAAEGDGAGRCTPKVTTYDLEIPITEYSLVRDSTGTQPYSSDDFSSFDDYESLFAPRRYSVKPLNPDPPLLKLRLIDTPGFDTPQDAGDKEVLESLSSGIRDLREFLLPYYKVGAQYVHAVAFVYSARGASKSPAFSTDGLLSSLLGVHHRLLPWSFFLLTHWQPGDVVGMRGTRRLNSEMASGGSENLLGSLKRVRSEEEFGHTDSAAAPTGPPTHFLIDSQPRLDEPDGSYAELRSRNTVYEILRSLEEVDSRRV
ncbi:hypothetical protein GE09DRAFT_292061 [Coniochaeta sp. 2T2.1]|nr:hypothetical protein GE09DRAFT_292061 [Coniochaeta sp. 2T2.1]